MKTVDLGTNKWDDEGWKLMIITTQDQNDDQDNDPKARMIKVTAQIETLVGDNDDANGWEPSLGD